MNEQLRESPSATETIEIYVQGENLPTIHLVPLPRNGKVRDIVEAARAKGLPAATDGHDVAVLIEDEEVELNQECGLGESGIKHRHNVHCHRCRRVHVSVTYNGTEKSHSFSSSTTVAKVKQWADDQFHLQGVDATEHALQVCDTRDRPSDEIHIGTLAQHPDCQVCFILAPKQRVEG